MQLEDALPASGPFAIDAGPRATSPSSSPRFGSPVVDGPEAGSHVYFRFPPHVRCADGFAVRVYRCPCGEYLGCLALTGSSALSCVACRAETRITIDQTQAGLATSCTVAEVVADEQAFDDMVSRTNGAGWKAVRS